MKVPWAGIFPQWAFILSYNIFYIISSAIICIFYYIIFLVYRVEKKTVKSNSNQLSQIKLGTGNHATIPVMSQSPGYSRLTPLANPVFLMRVFYE